MYIKVLLFIDYIIYYLYILRRFSNLSFQVHTPYTWYKDIRNEYYDQLNNIGSNMDQAMGYYSNYKHSNLLVNVAKHRNNQEMETSIALRSLVELPPCSSIMATKIQTYLHLCTLNLTNEELLLRLPHYTDTCYLLPKEITYTNTDEFAFLSKICKETQNIRLMNILSINNANSLTYNGYVKSCKDPSRDTEVYDKVHQIFLNVTYNTLSSRLINKYK